MSNFIYNSYCVEHPGVVQLCQVASSSDILTAAPRKPSRNSVWSAAGSSLAMGAVAVAAALMLVATHAQESMQAAWMALIVVAAAALALFTAPVRRGLRTLRSGLRAWEDARQQAAADELIWNAALQDARLMADLARAMDRQRRN